MTVDKKLGICDELFEGSNHYDVLMTMKMRQVEV